MPERRVLVADDEEATRFLIERILGNVGFKVVGAADGIEALQRLGEASYDLLITDLAMPRLNGAALSKAVQKSHPDMPIIVLSGVGGATDILELFRNNIAEYIHKPFRRGELLQVVARVTGVTAQPRPLPLERPRPAAAPSPTAPPTASPEGLPAVVNRLAEQLMSGQAPAPPFPEGLQQVLEFASSQNASSDPLVPLLQKVPGAPARVLSMANSPGYNTAGRRILDLQDAVASLGARTAANLSLLALEGDVCAAQDHLIARHLRHGWLRSRVASLLARDIARKTECADPEDVWTATLFADIGEMTLLRLVDEAELPFPESPRAQQLIGAALAEHHGPVGCRILEAWRLPPTVARAAGAHHQLALPTTMAPLGPEEQRLAACAAVGLHFVHTGREYNRLLHPPAIHVRYALDVLSLTEEHARQIYREASEAIRAALRA